MRVWVTGFGSFPGAPVNPTKRLVEQLGGLAPESVGAAELFCEVLPTDFSRAVAIVEERQRSLRPDIAVHFGLNRNAGGFRLERRAANAIGGDRPDAAGVVPQDRHVARDGPPALHSVWPAGVGTALRDAGLAVEGSDDAGAYVCNAVYYRSLGCATARPGAWCGFVHVPHSERSDRRLAAIGQAELLSGAIVIVRELTRILTRNLTAAIASSE
jgi:pyroglutamyl-peptidase